MALDGQAFSPKQFQLAIQGEAAIGTADVDGNMNLVNIDSISMPSLNLTQVFDVRSGSGGRVADVDDILIDEKGVTKEITFSGVFDQTIAPVLLNNICGGATVSSDLITIPYNYQPDELQTGASGDATKTLTLAIVNPKTSVDNGSNYVNRSMIFAGCVITSLSITGDMSNESGRLKFSATARTGYLSNFTEADPSVAAAFTAYGTSFYSLATLSGGVKRTIAGAADSVIQSFSLNIENPTEFVGQSTNGNPDAIVRAIPEISVTLDATVKYDSNSASYFEAQKANTDVISNLANDATIGSATSFGFIGSYGRITSVAYNEANAMMLDVSTKFFASAANPLIAITT
jgi:hypothetical protein